MANSPHLRIHCFSMMPFIMIGFFAFLFAGNAFSDHGENGHCRPEILSPINHFMDSHRDSSLSIYDGSEACRVEAPNGDFLVITADDRTQPHFLDFIQVWNLLGDERYISDLASLESEDCAVFAGCDNYLSHRPTNCNLIENGSFDFDSSGWNSNTEMLITNEGNRLVAGPGAMTFLDGWVSTVVEAEANKRYAISGYIGDEFGQDEWVGVGVDFLDSDGNEIGEIVRNGQVETTYKRFTLDKVSPADTAYMRFWGTSNGTRRVYLDEIEIIPFDCTLPVNYEDSPAISNPGDQFNIVGDSVELQILASGNDDRALRYTSSSLPLGLAIDPDTGVISGRVQAHRFNYGTRPVEVTVGNRFYSNTIRFRWTIDGPIYDSECNLLANGSFEGNLDGWSHNALVDYSTDHAEGQFALMYSDGWLSTKISVIEGMEYQLTGQYRMRDPDRLWRGFGIDYLDEKNDEIGEEVVQLYPNSDFSRLSLTGTVPAGVVSARLWFSTSSTVPFLVDNLVIKDIQCEDAEL